MAQGGEEVSHRQLLDDFIAWESGIGIRRSAVLFITLWMTWRAFNWAAEYASALIAIGGNDAWVAAAAMIAAVTAPITYLQAAVFRAYIESKQP
jgi:hypothetical protein